jgi:adenosylcobinamide-GDP ribazoletransferase
MRLYIIAIQFLTIIPLPFSVRCAERDLGRSLSFFPLAGLTLGALLVGLNYLMSAILPRGVVDILLIMALAVITGVLHLDGLADVCDGLAARGSRERFLAVMKDSRTGAAGAAGLILALLLKYQALLALPEDVKTQALFCFPMMARFAMVQMTVGARNARSDGLGIAFIAGAGWFQMLIATLTTLACAVLLTGIRGLWLFTAAYLLTWMMKAWSHRKIAGVTGDIIGCAGELNEILCLLMILAVPGKGGILP